MGAELRTDLQALKKVLEQNGEFYLARLVADALSGSDERLEPFVVSDVLWGGAGSIADQAGSGQDRQARKLLEVALILLGERQIQANMVNVRTATWVEQFRQWRRSGM